MRKLIDDGAKLIAALVLLFLILRVPFIVSFSQAEIGQQSPQSKSTGQEPHSWWYSFFADIRVTDTMLALFTGALVVVSYVQATRLRETINQMKLTEERELRAYVMIASAGIRYDHATRIPNATIVVRNYGQTPAQEVVSWAAISTRARPHVIPFEDHSNEPGFSKEILPPTRESNIVQDGPALSVWEEQQVISASGAIYIWGVIDYTDAFGKQRKTNFRYMCFGDGFRGGHLTPCPEGNDYT